MSAAMAIKACSTLVAFFALVSMNGIPISSANAFSQQKNSNNKEGKAVTKSILVLLVCSKKIK